MNATPEKELTDSELESLLFCFRTVDNSGGLMPSFIGTKFATQLEAWGFVETYEAEPGLTWQRLTALGFTVGQLIKGARNRGNER